MGNLEELKTKMKTGDYLPCIGTSELSETIMNSTDGKYSHVAVVIRINGKLFIIDAQKDGVFPRPFHVWHKKYGYEFEVWRNPKPFDENHFLDNAMRYSGVPYDMEHLGVGLFKSWIGSDEISDKYENNGKFVCTEYAMKLLGVNEPHKFTPQKVRDWLAANYIKIG